MPDLSIPATVIALAAQLGEPKPMRRGSLSERYVKCNKAGCPCAENEDARHGPYFSISRVVKGQTKSRWLDSDEAKIVCAQVEAGQQFRQHVEEYWQACEGWADAELEASEAAPKEAAKKGGSKRPSKPKSSPKSKR